MPCRSLYNLGTTTGFASKVLACLLTQGFLSLHLENLAVKSIGISSPALVKSTNEYNNAGFRNKPFVFHQESKLLQCLEFSSYFKFFFTLKSLTSALPNLYIKKEKTHW